VPQARPQLAHGRMLNHMDAVADARPGAALAGASGA
jgi:hypothetical protein